MSIRRTPASATTAWLRFSLEFSRLAYQLAEVRPGDVELCNRPSSMAEPFSRS